MAGGRRVEIKGVGHHRGLPLLVHNEAYRQLNLLRIREELLRRGVERAALELPDSGRPWEQSPRVTLANRLLQRCDFAPLRDALERGETVCGLSLPGFGGLLTRPTQPGVTFARELTDRVRVIACLESRPFLLHSDLADYGLRSSEWRSLRQRLRASKDDTLVVVWGPEQDAATAAREIFRRAWEATVGVPAETRQAFRDATNGFERILPGPDRMYPDTDTPPLAVRDETVTQISSNLPEPPWEREARYIAMELEPAEARRLADAGWADLFDASVPPAGALARRLAAALRKRIPHHRKRTRGRELPDATRLSPLIRAIAAGEVRGEALEPAFDALVEQHDTSADEVLARFRPGPDDTAELRSAVAAVAGRAACVAGKPREAGLRWAMGQVMPRFLGRVDPKDVTAALEAVLPSPVAEGEA